MNFIQRPSLASRLLRSRKLVTRKDAELAFFCAAAAAGCGVVAWTFDRACEHFKATGNKPLEAFADGGAHIATGLTVALPAVPFVQKKWRFLAVAALSAVAIDLDHVVAARSVALVPCMTMPNRPASHSLITLGLAVYIAERALPGTQTELAIGLGLGSHLLRDIATGGAPLFLPRKIISVARPPVVLLIVALGIFARWYSRFMLDPERPRRSNPAVLAPEGLVVGSRILRGARASYRAA